MNHAKLYDNFKDKFDCEKLISQLKKHKGVRRSSDIPTEDTEYGDKAVLFGRMIPVFREMISVPAGLLKMPIKKFLLYTILGSCGWGVTMVMVGYFFGIATFEMI